MADFKTPVKPKGGLKLDSISVPPSPFLKQLGYGTGVSVYEMARSPLIGKVRSPWAIKRISQKIKDKKIYGARLHEEAKLLRQMDHPNVVGYRGFTKMSDGRQCLAMESCGESLGSRIESRAEDSLGPYPPNNILKVALDISKGLDYIHTKMKLMHGDVKSFNILVNGDFAICKLCDFGVSLPLDENGALDYRKTIENYIGTACWSAPEVIRSEGLVTSKADMFSFGLTLWEMLALEPPHIGNIDENESLDDSVILVEDSLMEDDPSSSYGTRPSIPDINKEEFKDVLSLFYCMTEEIPLCRPTAHHITLCVEDMLQHEQNIKPN